MEKAAGILLNPLTNSNSWQPGAELPPMQPVQLSRGLSVEGPSGSTDQSPSAGEVSSGDVGGRELPCDSRLHEPADKKHCSVYFEQAVLGAASRVVS